MKNSSFILLAAATLCSFSSCKKVEGEGPVETESRSVSNFSGIAANIGGTVYFSQAPEFKVELSAQRNMLNLIETDKAGNDLILKFKNGVNVGHHTDIRVHISAPSLENLQLNGSGKVHVTGDFVANQFNAALNGSGNLLIDNLRINDLLTSGVNGSGNIRVLAGTVDTENVKIIGSGNVDLSAVKATTSIAKISGSGTIKLNVVKNLDVTVSGSGNVFYYGNPVINTHIFGTGRVVRL